MKTARILTSLVFILFVLAFLARGAQAAGAVQPAGDIQDPQDLEKFWDGVIPAQLQNDHVAGAVVAVVKDGKLAFAKGYGYADLAAKKPVSAEQTLFRVGSLSKLFVGTAVMQLAEQGKLDLNADVNTYLKDFQIPATFPQPITLAHLLTHTSGLDSDLSAFVAGASDLRPLGAYLAGRLPRRVYPPGQVAAYSNYGISLAGYIVEVVSGMPFDQYVAGHIFQPLGMAHSSFTQPLPADLSAALSNGYLAAGAQLIPRPFEYVQVWPAGSMSATAADMARFMVAQLQDGRYENAVILSPATAQEMHRLHFQADPQVSGMAYTFEEMHLNGMRLLTKTGDTLLFHSILALIPEQNTGVFVAYNSSGGAKSHEDVLQPFLDRYFPTDIGGNAPAVVPVTGAAADAAQYAGVYTETETAANTYQKFYIAVGQFFFVSPSPEGGITAPDEYFRPHRFVETAPGVFRQMDGQEMLVFKPGGMGGRLWMYEGNLPIVAFYRLPWYESPPLHMILLLMCILLFLSAIIAWPIASASRRRRGLPVMGLRRAGQWLAGLAGGLDLLLVIGMVILVATPPGPIFGLNRVLFLKATLTAGILAAALTLGVVVSAVLAWRRGRPWSLAGRVHYTLVALACAVFVFILNTWNLLGYRL